MTSPRRQTIATAALLAALLAGCTEAPPPTGAAPRPVKLEQMSAAATDTTQTFVGTLRARQRAELGFEQPGRIAALLVDVGDRVSAGQVLARLDAAPAQWRLDKAQADRTAAAAALAERTTQLRQHEALAKDQIISATALEAVQTQHRLALSQLQAAEAALAMARRDLALSDIRAPFDGEIVARAAQPHSDVGAGQMVLQIEAGRALEVVSMLPEAAAAPLQPGQTATARLGNGAQGGATRRLALERLSTHSDNGSLVQAVFRLEGAAPGLRSGSVVSVELPRTSTAGLSVPAAALLPANAPGSASVFLFDAARGTLVRRAVQIGREILPGGRIPVTSGLQAGDQVVVAGAAFLTEGQAAVPHAPTTLLHGAQP
ncbi:efflux RND transporter periplasmic adaptor subunit [Hydrogenophaga luteola]|uniref:Efflux RND transporter periplasmic adaptor subunit n=1 Tax=Hydrogenophaga luteola TaxID=1591122 RepID=A0ABV7W924_9BURK